MSNHEKQDIRCSTYLNGVDYLAVKSCREQFGLSESAFFRMAALKLVDQLTRESLLRERGLDGSSESGRF